MSNDRHEFPNEWILSPNGDPKSDEDYVFVGTTGVYYSDPETNELYHIGVTAFGELIGSWSQGGPGSIIYPEDRAVETYEIPKAAKQKLASEGLLQIGTLSGNLTLRALGIDLPTDIEPISFARLFNGTVEEKQAELEKQVQWLKLAGELSGELVIE